MPERRILHCADLHLDTPFRGLLARDERLGERLRQAPFEALDRIVRHAKAYEVEAVLIAGDAFDSDDSGLAAQFALRDALKELEKADIPVFIVAGNHDPYPSWSEQVRLPDNTVLLGAEAPERYTIEREGMSGIEFVGMSFPRASVNENLAKAFPQAGQDRFSIALLHGTVGEAGAHEPYNPFRVEDVKDKGYEFWAMGHIHQRRTPHPERPLIHYPGVPQGRHPNENGPKGCSLIRFQDGKAPQLEFLTTHSVRYENLKLDLSGLEQFGELEEALETALQDLEAPEKKDSYVLRITLEGRTSLHSALEDPAKREELREHLSYPPQGDAPFRWIDRLEDHTWPDRDPEELRQRGDLVGELWRNFEELKADPERSEALIEELKNEFGGNSLSLDRKALSEQERQEVVERALWKLMDEFLKSSEEGE